MVGKDEQHKGKLHINRKKNSQSTYMTAVLLFMKLSIYAG